MKKGGSKISLDCPYKRYLYCNPHMLMFNLSANHWVFVSQIPILSKIQRPDHLVTLSLYTQTGSGEGVGKLIIVQDKSPHPFFFPLVWNEKKEKESLHNNYYPSVVQYRAKILPSSPLFYCIREKKELFLRWKKNCNTMFLLPVIKQT